MNDGVYRVLKTTLALDASDGHRGPVTLPLDALIVYVGPADRDTLIEVTWGGKMLLIADHDLRERLELV